MPKSSTFTTDAARLSPRAGRGSRASGHGERCLVAREAQRVAGLREDVTHFSGRQRHAGG